VAGWSAVGAAAVGPAEPGTIVGRLAAGAEVGAWAAGLACWVSRLLTPFVRPLRPLFAAGPVLLPPLLPPGNKPPTAEGIHPCSAWGNKDGSWGCRRWRVAEAPAGGARVFKPQSQLFRTTVTTTQRIQTAASEIPAGPAECSTAQSMQGVVGL
jgi:hypothetical protein